MPHLGKWLDLYSIFDLRRNGIVQYTELEQGLSTACSPEVNLVKNSTMVARILQCMSWVEKQNAMLTLLDRLAEWVTRLQRGFGSAIRFMRRNEETHKLQTELDFFESKVRVASASKHIEKVRMIDEHIYGK